MDNDQTKPLHIPPQAIIAPSPALSQSSTVFEATPKLPRHRATFARLNSVDNGIYTAIKDQEDDIVDTSPDNNDQQVHHAGGEGLGITITKGGDMETGLSTANMNSGSEIYEMSMLGASKPQPKQSVVSFQSTLQHNTTYEPDTQRLRNHRSFAESLQTAYDDFGPTDTCAAHQIFHHDRKDWLSITILILAIYSTTMSGIFLVLAILGPRYNWIRKGGHMTPYFANLLTAFFAKTIELSFATVFVSFLGQVLSRRAFMKKFSRGITLAEMDMRSWVISPGTMIFKFGALKSSILSFLGVLSLVAAIVAMLYTTACESLVQPYLRFGNWEHMSMQGFVRTSPSNVYYLGQNCGTPILTKDDSESANTCMQIQYAAQSYYNYQRYIADWSIITIQGNGSSDPAERPKGFAMMFENTTVTAPWIDLNNSNVAVNSAKHGRIINNVTLALPHAGVPAACWNGANRILQPEDLNGQGIYNLQASVPSPAINVLCAQMTEKELAPVVYTQWNDNKLVPEDWPAKALAFYQPGNIVNGTYLNKTVVDDIFEWGEAYQTSPPVFPSLPIAYNTVLNDTGVWGRNAIYLLGQGSSNNYALCSVKVFQTPYCSTEYNASQVGATLEAKCDDSPHANVTNSMRYIDSLWNATSGSSTIVKDWVEIAQEWATSLSLGSGISDANASNSRLLTQFMLTDNETLNKAEPSMAEALAVMASSTLLMSWQDTPFVQFYNYTNNMISPPERQWFNALLRAQEYASGGSGEPATRTFYVVLLAAFIINILCLVYFISQNGLVTDFSEPMNLFSLAVNSPPSDVMAGSCATGPRGKQYRAAWYVKAIGEHLYMENKIDTREVGEQDEHERDQQRVNLMSPIHTAAEKMSWRKSWF